MRAARRRLAVPTDSSALHAMSTDGCA